jgi:hypothetical protein
MSIFERIKTAIFGSRNKPAATTPATAPAPAPRPAAAGAPVAPAPTVPEVDIEEVMEGYASRTAQKLNWRTSIVDLLKLLDVDSSLENRKELAKELGYAGNTSDSATMNVWLHKQVLRKLQENGGKVPTGLAD